MALRWRGKLARKTLCGIADYYRFCADAAQQLFNLLHRSRFRSNIRRNYHHDASENPADMKVAITGAATGIGAQVAKKFKALGYHVTAFDIIEPKDNIDQWIQTDMADPQSIDAAMAKATGPFDILINNAGIPPREGNAINVLAINFIGFRRFLNAMLSQLSAGATIVNSASRAGAMWQQNIEQSKALFAIEDAQALAAFIEQHDIDHVRAYNLSKEAVIAMTLARTEEMNALGFRMNSVSPAAVSTAILEDFVNAFGDKVNQNLARAGRAGQPEEIADVIVFLASAQSAWLKGVDIVIDGGMSAMSQADAMGLA